MNAGISVKGLCGWGVKAPELEAMSVLPLVLLLRSWKSGLTQEECHQKAVEKTNKGES